MAIIKKDDVMPERPVIITLYGIPGSGKTSTANTSNKPLLIDCDRGASRATNRVDTLVAQNWNDIASEIPEMKEYKTVIVDTVRSVSEDFLSDYVINQNYKLKTNSLKRYGEIGVLFKEFVNSLRNFGVDIVFVAHDKETTEGDIVKHSPDCIGQSKELLLRISDQVGYITVINGKRTILWEPSDTITGKNVAQFKPTEIPEPTDPKYPTFFADLIKSVKHALVNKSEAQRKANALLEELRAELDKVVDDKTADELMKKCVELPQVMKQPFFMEIKENLSSKGFTYAEGKFTKPAGEKAAKTKKSNEK